MQKRILSNLYYQLVMGKEKAVGGAIVAFLAAFVVQHLGYHVSNGLQQVVVGLVVAALTHASVYFTSNTQG